MGRRGRLAAESRERTVQKLLATAYAMRQGAWREGPAVVKEVLVTPCPKCSADAGKPRVGTLGEHKGYWCTACGHTAPSLDAWRGSDQTQRSVAAPLSGEYLDTYARAYGLARAPGETDAALHQRIRSYTFAHAGRRHPPGLTAALDRFLKAHGYARTVNDDAAQIQIIGVWLGGDPNKQYTVRHIAKHYGYRVAQDDTDEQLLDRMCVSP
jgi:hypothetical protein